MTVDLVVVGGGQAAFSLVAKLRSLGDSRSITILTAEDVAPYQRPPLSKKYLLGEMEFDRLQMRPDGWYADHTIDLRLSTFVEEINLASRSVRTQDGSSLNYSKLVLATGAAPRRLPAAIGGALENVFVMRDKRDADRLAAAFKPGARALVIGGGYIGLEAAAVARHKELQVTLIEMADRILKRVASSQTADVIRDIHESHGVTIRESTGLRRLLGEDGKLVGAELADGTVIDLDLAIVGIGVTANTALAQAAGLTVTDGIVVDSMTRTSDPDVHAIGDCASMPWQNTMIRLESVQNAVDQAEALAEILAGGNKSYEPKPWFWSDQYDVKLQIAGLNLGFDETFVRPGARPGSQSIWYFREKRFVAVDAINDAKAYVTGKKLLDSNMPLNRSILEDPTRDLKELLA
ncbi:NAD(P)/FAD-dependent oxidoreductase [Rhizobium lemnae]|uniref:NAD(P)/FAD-dependent oxidoreductase n=1 Tax=Rhizobium lemnae TaxID=1214924 RepID=A0ABV8E400_9HYPH|nr:FAD/NAD(P)-binding oxidoreductase [Rhizobium lemnae]MCJ8507635.1 NAD(P)/FAD-dependent oxidoreductase [Rhizobium lemnae]